jgi:hypothetical protein
MGDYPVELKPDGIDTFQALQSQHMDELKMGEGTPLVGLQKGGNQGVYPDFMGAKYAGNDCRTIEYAEDTIDDDSHNGRDRSRG